MNNFPQSKNRCVIYNTFMNNSPQSKNRCVIYNILKGERVCEFKAHDIIDVCMAREGAVVAVRELGCH
jgi:hypothetical protein